MRTTRYGWWIAAIVAGCCGLSMVTRAADPDSESSPVCRVTAPSLDESRFRTVNPDAIAANIMEIRESLGGSPLEDSDIFANLPHDNTVIVADKSNDADGVISSLMKKMAEADHAAPPCGEIQCGHTCADKPCCLNPACAEAIAIADAACTHDCTTQCAQKCRHSCSTKCQVQTKVACQDACKSTCGDACGKTAKCGNCPDTKCAAANCADCKCGQKLNLSERYAAPRADTLVSSPIATAPCLEADCPGAPIFAPAMPPTTAPYWDVAMPVAAPPRHDVHVLREAAIRLEQIAHELERLEKYVQADALREQADALRADARAANRKVVPQQTAFQFSAPPVAPLHVPSLPVPFEDNGEIPASFWPGYQR